jgi:hypothetical protein
MHLVYAMAARNLSGSGMAAAQETVADLLGELQAASTQPLWPPVATVLEAPENRSYPMLRRLVCRLLDCMFFEPELKVKWVCPHLCRAQTISD